MSALIARRYYLRALDEMRRNELDDACQDLQAAIQLIPAFYEARIAYSVALLRLKDPPRAVQMLRAGMHHNQQGLGRAQLMRPSGQPWTPQNRPQRTGQKVWKGD